MPTARTPLASVQRIGLARNAFYRRRRTGVGWAKSLTIVATSASGMHAASNTLLMRRRLLRYFAITTPPKHSAASTTTIHSVAAAA